MAGWMLAGALTVAAVFAGCQSDQTVKAARAYGRAEALSAYGARPSQTAMLRMARTVETLQATLRASPDGGVDAPEVERLLGELDLVAADFSTDPSVKQHPAMQRDFSAFLVDVLAARNAAKATPPDTAPAQAITAACYHCHKN